MDLVDFSILGGNVIVKLDMSCNRISLDEFVVLDKLVSIDMENLSFLTKNNSFAILLSSNLKNIDLSENFLSPNHFELISKMTRLEIIELRRVGLQSMTQINLRNK